MSDTFLTGVLERSFDLQNINNVNKISSIFKLTLPSPVIKNRSFSNIHALNSIIPPPPPSPCEWINNKDLNYKETNVDNNKICIIL